MKTSTIRYLIATMTIWVSFFDTDLFGQLATVTSGADFSSPSGSVAFSVGQISYSTVSGSDRIVMEGVQQPYEFSIVSSVWTSPAGIRFSVFPNPAQGELVLQASGAATDKLTFEVRSTVGELITNGIVLSAETRIDIHHLPTATYLMLILEDKVPVNACIFTKIQ